MNGVGFSHTHKTVCVCVHACVHVHTHRGATHHSTAIGKSNALSCFTDVPPLIGELNGYDSA